MTRQEFESMTGLQVTDEQMWKIHEVYVNMEGDKEFFCCMVKTMGQEAVDFLCRTGERMAATRGHIEELQEENSDLTEFIYRQSVEPDEYDAKEKAIELFGRDEYYARLVEDDKELDRDARDYISSKLRA